MFWKKFKQIKRIDSPVYFGVPSRFFAWIFKATLSTFGTDFLRFHLWCRNLLFQSRQKQNKNILYFYQDSNIQQHLKKTTKSSIPVRRMGFSGLSCYSWRGSNNFDGHTFILSVLFSHRNCIALLTYSTACRGWQRTLEHKVIK